MAVRYEFYYETPTQQPDGSGGTITVNVPTTFSLGGIALPVAKAIRAGLIARATQAGIANVSATRVQDATDTITDTST